ncbi:hypothetical protein [Mycobacteroides abscessus]|uniref:hypothetical protein n=1 Tax=Mycobacteroides abscessus TaxID=36809 RepID=UPI00092C6759|nr:hypothetical protein [Mycobacteroides abscessus]SIF35524.1 Uncharacterised protein [Mycobacteroides abscessus subsp. abscessus]
MSWNATRFAKVMGERDRPLLIWLSTDALAHVHADNGYVSTIPEAMGIVMEALATHPRIVIGLAERPEWDDLIGAENAEPDYASNERIVEVTNRAGLCDLAVQLAGTPGFAELNVALMRYLQHAEVGGGTRGMRGELLGCWVSNMQWDRLPHGSTLGTVAAALRMFSDPQARDDAACVQSTGTVQVMKPAKAKRARVSPNRDVHVIDVRPRITAASSGGGRTVEHDHRWVVRGHWRNQPCGPGRTLRRRIWIQSHVAGPADAPLRRDPTVYRIA